MLTQIESEPWHGRHTAQLSLLAASAPLMPRSITLADQLAWDEELLGYPVSVHPLDLWRDRLAHVISSRLIADSLDRSIVLAGNRLAHHHLKSATGESMLLVDMTDQFGRYQVLWGGAALRQYRAIINRRGNVLVRGRVKADRHGRPIVMGSSIEVIDSELQ